MRHSKTERIIAISASLCLLLAFGCGLLGLGIQQGAVTPPDINVQLGPLVITTLGPRSFNCPLQNGPSMNICDGLRIVPRLAAYRIWLFGTRLGMVQNLCAHSPNGQYRCDNNRSSAILPGGSLSPKGTISFPWLSRKSQSSSGNWKHR